ncbi:competence protein CoiA [Mesobacillus subterraneus]|uniref:competence protein CoiA n=1 Tax=Mesobacillus subterraneus TaxID=285983 RepID=UPI001475B0F3|nr:competence protein CoiA family protein [Mesobacillus subterraneus]
MLVANRSNGERLSLGASWTKEELVKIRSNDKFHCPQCKEEVILKLGSRKIWHFSHLAGSSCESRYDRESEYHLSGKLQLYNWLIHQGINAELEKYDEQIRQKPDITFEWQNQKYALEFQCSVIPEELFVKRNSAYLENDYIPVWIAAESLIKRKGSFTVSMNQFLYLFLRQPERTWSLPAYCPITKQFVVLHGAIPLSSRKTLTNLQIHPLSTCSINQLINPVAKPFPMLKSWQTENQKIKSRYLMYPGAQNNRFLQDLYLNRLNLLTLPPEIGLPVYSSPFIETPSFIWQAYLYLDVLRHYKAGEVIHYPTIREAFNKRLRTGDILLRNLPASGERTYLYALAEYIFLLTKVTFLTKIDSGTVKVKRELCLHGNYQDAVESAAEFFKRFQNKIEEDFFQRHEKIVQSVK